ncbi:MAG: SirB2 family protein [Pseudomonadales bacterium]|nr:SirB2 family protein [Pseudomonadales bacterium]
MTWYIHVSCVVLSGSFFLVRGFWMLTDNAVLQNRLVKVLPHVIDTVLLGSAITLTFFVNQYPLVNHWLTVKVVALVVYILLGVVALRGNTPSTRITAFTCAILTFGFIVSVAWYHHPLGLFVLLVY